MANVNGNEEQDVRDSMFKFWKQPPSIETMLQTNAASSLTDGDLADIISYLPRSAYEGKNVVDLACGIGRFTYYFSKYAKHVEGVDFQQQFLDELHRLYPNLKNVDTACADVRNLQYPAGSKDLVFSNWLLQYLSDSEVVEFLSRSLAWLTNGGYVVIRESCFQRSGDKIKDGKENPTKYRDPSYYYNLFASIQNEHGKFEVVKSRNIQTYVVKHGYATSLNFILRKIGNTDSETVEDLKEMESIFGSGFGNPEAKCISEIIFNDKSGIAGKKILDISGGTAGMATGAIKNGALLAHALLHNWQEFYVAVQHQKNMPKNDMAKLTLEHCSMRLFEPAEPADLVTNTRIIDYCDRQLLLSVKGALASGGKMKLFVSSGLGAEDLRKMAEGTGFRGVTVAPWGQSLSSLRPQLQATPNNSQARRLLNIISQDQCSEVHLYCVQGSV